MAQQPNVEITDAERPRSTPQPGPAVKWRANKPGIPGEPSDVPFGPLFGYTGPDPGWGLKLVRDADLPDQDPRLRKVMTGLVLARAAANGRAPIPEDIETALVLCGYFDGAPKDVIQRRERWLHAVHHEERPGQTAVAEVGLDFLANKPEQIRYALKSKRKGQPSPSD